MKRTIATIALFLALVIAGIVLPPKPEVHAADPKATPKPTQCPDRPRCVCDASGKIITCQIMLKK